MGRDAHATGRMVEYGLEEKRQMTYNIDEILTAWRAGNKDRSMFKGMPDETLRELIKKHGQSEIFLVMPLFIHD
jgi:hypothetical protein